MIKAITQLLKQPYPEQEGMIHYLKGSLAIGFVIFGLLYWLRPFGLEHSDQLLESSLIFGVITSAVSFLFDLTLFYLVRIDRDKPTWVFWKWLLTTLLLVVFIGIVNFLVIQQLDDLEFHWKILLQSIGYTLTLGLIPLFVVGAFKLGNAKGRYEQMADEVSLTQSTAEARLFTFETGAKKEKLRLSSDDILFVESMQNYVMITHRQAGSPIQIMIRNTMKSLEARFQGTSIVRCHRSFLVNREKIEQVSGNAQGLKLQLEGLEDVYVPVSRTYLSLFEVKGSGS